MLWHKLHWIHAYHALHYKEYVFKKWIYEKYVGLLLGDKVSKEGKPSKLSKKKSFEDGEM